MLSSCRVRSTISFCSSFWARSASAVEATSFSARCNKVHQFSLARGHWLALRFQTFVTLARGRNRESQIVQSLERLFFLSSRALFVGLGGALCSLLFRKFSARSIQFAFEFGDAF